MRRILCCLLILFSVTVEALQFQKVSSFSNVVAIAHPEDGSNRLFLVQQTGQIHIRKGVSLLPRLFLNLHSAISCCGERGLLGMAFDPAYRTNGFFYVDFTNQSGDIVIARFKVSSNPDVANPASKKILLTIPHREFSNHNGGQLAFGSDRFLYIGIGDGGSGGDPGNNAQNLSVLLGKILRIDVSHGLPYAIPANNPFVHRSGARPEIYEYGLRNPWRFSFDRQNGDLWIGDVGQDQWEEVDFLPVNLPSGKNLGWRLMEGKHCFNPQSGCNNGTLKLPLLEYNHDSETHCAIIGGYRYRGRVIPSLSGAYVYGDFCSGFIWTARPQNGKWTATLLQDTSFQISTFGEDASGELYVADYNSGVYQLNP